MKILLSSVTSQTLAFIPRSFPVSVDYTLIREGTNIEVVKTNVPATTNKGFLEISDIFTLIENNFYSIDIFDNTTNLLIFRDKIYCTNQNVKDYTINKDEYKEDKTYDKNYVIYEK